MDETDGKVSSTLSSLDPFEQEGLQSRRIEKLLGRRAHLLDELLRIHAMFADFDPDLQVNTLFYLKVYQFYCIAFSGMSLAYF